MMVILNLTSILLLLWACALGVFSQASSNSSVAWKTRAQMFVQLKNQLFNKYDKSLHPVGMGMDQFDASIVSVRIEFLSIEDVSTGSQKFASRIRAVMNWNDMALAWKKEDYGNITYLLVQQQKMWIPDIIVSNALKSANGFGFDSMPIRLTDEGAVHWEPVEVVTTSCNLDVTFFPFDAQVCVLRLSTAVSLKWDVVFRLMDGNVTFADLEPNGEWELVETKCREVVSGRSAFDIYVKLRRRRTYSVLNLIMPVLFLSLTATIVFALPTESGERMALGITILLAFAVFLTIAFEQLPKTSLQISILIVYITMLMAASALSIVLSVFTLNCYHRDPREPIPVWIRCCMGWLRSRTSCFNPDAPMKTSGDVIRVKVKPLKTGNDEAEAESHPRIQPGLNKRKSSDTLTKLFYILSKTKVDPADSEAITSPKVANAALYGKDANSSGNSPVPDPLIHDVMDGCRSRQQQASSRRGSTAEPVELLEKLTWKVVAKTFDSFFFRLFTWLVVMPTVVCLMLLIIGGSLDAGGMSLPE